MWLGRWRSPSKRGASSKKKKARLQEDALPHVRIAVPYSWGSGNIDTAYPVVVDSGGHLVLSSPYSSRLRRALSSEVRHMERGAEDEHFAFRKLAYEVVPAAGAPKERFEYEVVADRWIAADILRKVVRDYYRRDLKFRYPPEGMEEDLFYRHLGLYRYEGMYYKIAGGICWDVLDEAPVNDLEILKRVAPKNVYFIDRDTYLRSDGYYYDAVARVDIGGRVVPVECSLPDNDYILEVFDGDCRRLREELEKSARCALSAGHENPGPGLAAAEGPAGSDAGDRLPGTGSAEEGPRAGSRYGVLERLSAPPGSRSGVSL